MTVSNEVIKFYTDPPFSKVLGNHLRIHNPFDDPERRDAIVSFCNKYYDDLETRTHILGINPSRLTATATGINYTDGFALEVSCGIANDFAKSRELTAEFFYKVVEDMGGASAFYTNVFAWAAMPMSITQDEAYKNYYEKDTIDTVKGVVQVNIKWITKNIPSNGRVVILGIGENKRALRSLPGYPFGYEKIDYLPHPRWIMQYNREKVDKYVDMYSRALI